MDDEIIIKLAEKVQEALTRIEEENRRFNEIEAKFDRLSMRMERGLFGMVFTVFVLIGSLITAPEKLADFVKTMIGTTVRK